MQIYAKHNLNSRNLINFFTLAQELCGILRILVSGMSATLTNTFPFHTSNGTHTFHIILLPVTYLRAMMVEDKFYDVIVK